MQPPHPTLYVLAFLLLLAGRPCPGQPAPATDNEEVAGLYEADQADRRANLDWDALGERDAERRRRVRALLEADRLRTSEDYRRAALIFHHGPFGDTASVKVGHELAGIAVGLDSLNEAAHWLWAATWDRYLMYSEKPQWYGTQVRLMESGELVLHEVDTTRITDAERARLGIDPLDVLRERAERRNREMQARSGNR